MTRRSAFAISMLLAGTMSAEEKAPQTMTLRVAGLFEPGRDAELRAALEKVPGVTLASVDLEHGEGVFNYDPAVAFKDAHPDKKVERLNEWLRNASRGLFGVAPLPATPHEKLTRVEIKVVPIDCKACALAMHEILMKVDGVAQALVSRKDGVITAMIQPEKTSRAALEEVLKKRELMLQKPS